MRTDDLIVHLARSAEPVRPLPGPLLRMAQWTAGAAVVAALGVLVIHPRADIGTALHQPAYVWVALLTAATGLLSAAAAFVLSVPGAERSPVQRALPILAASAWAIILGLLLAAGEHPVQRVLALPVHLACIAEIAGLGAVPAWVLFRMLKRAAPLSPVWSALLATLAAVGVSALATQLICPIDDPAHQLVSHFLPAALLVSFGAVSGRRWLDVWRS